MGPRTRPPAVNERMPEAHHMMGVVEKAMEGERLAERHPTLHGNAVDLRHSLMRAYCLKVFIH